MVLFIGLGSGGGSILSRMQLLGGLACVWLVDLFPAKAADSAAKRAALVVFAALCAVVLLKANYTYVYRDAPMKQLTQQVPSGLCRGVYTTQGRVNTLTQMEAYLQESFTADDSVLFMETVPFAYLMTDAKICAPSTWDLSFYSYGFNDDTIYQRYFASVGSRPDYIVYIDTGRDDQLSVAQPDYRFTRYVNTYYEKMEERMVGGMLVLTYKHKG